MKVLLTGATGLVGKNLIEFLIEQQHDIRVLSTRPAKQVNLGPCPMEVFSWQPENNQIDQAALKGVDAVIHLAGESVAEGRWSEDKKNKILHSRIQTTGLLIQTIKDLPQDQRPKHFISASAIGIYGDRADEILTENSTYETSQPSFLSHVCQEWEKASKDQVPGMMTSHVRVGIVLSNQGGALAKMLPPFQMGAGGPLGNGKQFMSWIHNDDLARLFIFIMENKLPGVFNGVAPTPVDNTTFSKVLGKVLKRPVLFPVPVFAIKLLFGEMSTILLSSQRVKPEASIQKGFKFKFDSLFPALENILGLLSAGKKKIVAKQWLPFQVEEVFNFFAAAENLEKITPDYLEFKILKMSTAKIEKGTLIDYRLKIHGIPVHWQTEITDWDKNSFFSDCQLKGPYKIWFHRHFFVPYKNGTYIKDEVDYLLPLGSLGNFLGHWPIKRDLAKIFNHRQNVIANLFPAKPQISQMGPS